MLLYIDGQCLNNPLTIRRESIKIIRNEGDVNNGINIRAD